MEGTEHLANMEVKRNAYRALVGRYKGNKPLCSPTYKLMCKDNIKTKLKYMICNDVQWINPSQHGIKCQHIKSMILNLWVS